MKNLEYYNKKEGVYKLSGGREKILSGLILDNVKTVLDVGCGSGDLARILQAKGKVVSGADFLEKTKSLVTSGGYLIITTPNFLFWKNRLKMLFGNFRYEQKGLLDFGHIRFFTLKTAREVFSKAGFTIQQEQHFYPNLYKRRLNVVLV